MRHSSVTHPCSCCAVPRHMCGSGPHFPQRVPESLWQGLLRLSRDICHMSQFRSNDKSNTHMQVVPEAAVTKPRSVSHYVHAVWAGG